MLGFGSVRDVRILMVSRTEPPNTPRGSPPELHTTAWPKIRDDMIDTHIKAIMEADLQAKAAPEATESGVPPKAR